MFKKMILVVAVCIGFTMASSRSMASVNPIPSRGKSTSPAKRLEFTIARRPTRLRTPDRTQCTWDRLIQRTLSVELEEQEVLILTQSVVFPGYRVVHIDPPRVPMRHPDGFQADLMSNR